MVSNIFYSVIHCSHMLCIKLAFLRACWLSLFLLIVMHNNYKYRIIIIINNSIWMSSKCYNSVIHFSHNLHNRAKYLTNQSLRHEGVWCGGYLVPHILHLNHNHRIIINNSIKMNNKYYNYVMHYSHELYNKLSFFYYLISVYLLIIRNNYEIHSFR